LKLDGQWETWLKKSETKDQNGKSMQIEGLIQNWPILVPFPFKRNDMFGQNNIISYIVHKKKKAKRCRFKRHQGSSSSPRHVEAGEEEVSLPCNTAPSLSTPLAQETPHDPYPHIPYHYNEKPGEPCLAPLLYTKRVTG